MAAWNTNDATETPSGNIKLTKAQYNQMKRDHDAAIEREREMRGLLNSWQMILQSAGGNIAKVTKDVQTYLKDTVIVENKP